MPLPHPIPSSSTSFDDCPAYYLRTVGMEMPAEHLIDETTHPAQFVGEWAVEIENGARNVDTLSPKAREGVHLWFAEKAEKREHDDELRRAGREKRKSHG